jgi:hypothetical protein
LREKVIEPDFSYINVDGRLSLARLCALQDRYDEAKDWFAKARTPPSSAMGAPCRCVCRLRISCEKSKD